MSVYVDNTYAIFFMQQRRVFLSVQLNQRSGGHHDTCCEHAYIQAYIERHQTHARRKKQHSGVRVVNGGGGHSMWGHMY